MTAIESNKKYKIEKEAYKLEQKKKKRLEAEKLKYNKLIQNNIAKIKKRYDTKLEKRLKKIEKEYDRRRIDTKYKILGKPIKLRLPNLSKLKNRALKEIQEYAKLKRAERNNGKIVIYLMDKLTYVELSKKVNAGHCYGQRNYPQLAFDIHNIRPITNWTNKQQGDQVGNWIENLGLGVQMYLRDIASNQELKNKLRDHKYYQDIIEKYQKLNAKERKRLGII